MTLTRTGRETLAVAALAALWLAATAWTRPLMLPDEGRYVGVAWEMLRSGNWLTPTLDGLPYFHKPPLFYWITAAAMSVFGRHEWAARAAPLLGAWLGAMALYLFVRRWWGERAARFSLLALLVQPLFYVGAQFANLDMLVAGCIVATITLLAHAALSIEQGLPYRAALLAAYAAAAIGVLAKGLIGALLPALVVGSWLLALRRWRTLPALLWWPGPLLFMLLAAPWFGAMQQRFDGFLDYFFIVQHFKRFAEAGFNNVQPFWFYPAVLFVFSLPWLPWLYKPFERGALADPERGPLRLLMLLWVAMVVLFFSLPRSKLLGYVLPAVPPLACLMADGYLTLDPSVQARRLWRLSAGITLALGVGAVAALSLHPLRSSRELAAVLSAQRGADEPVLMVENYAFDLPFYARLREPVVVVDDWPAARADPRDTWRKELADAGRFAPARAAALLVEPAALCTTQRSWVVGPSGAQARYPLLAHAVAVASHGDTTLWRVDATGCEGRPNAG